jgi:hypothetical protein
MCAISPKHQKHFTLSVYTSLNMTEEEFLELIYAKVMLSEIELNADARLRWHVKETI